MNTISLFSKTLIILTFIWCITESIMPENYIRKNISFVYGIIIISYFFKCLSGIDLTVLDNWDSKTKYQTTTQEYIKEVYERCVEDALKDKYKNESIVAELTDEYKIKKIYCDDEKITEEIMRDLIE